MARNHALLSPPMAALDEQKRPLADRVRGRAYRLGLKAYRRSARKPVSRMFHTDLIAETTNFGHTTWLGVPIWQNVLDLWTIQESIAEIRPALLIETGTNRGGSALFYAHLMDLMGTGRVLTIDIE